MVEATLVIVDVAVVDVVNAVVSLAIRAQPPNQLIPSTWPREPMPF